MVKTIKNVIARLFPEIVSGYHLPLLGRVIAISETAQGGYTDHYRPAFAVDIQPLKPDYSTDETNPPVLAVPFPVMGAGNDTGFYAFPAVGATVIYGFAGGSNAAPVVLQVLSVGLASPSLQPGAMLWQQNGDNYQAITNSGNWQRYSVNGIYDESHTIRHTANDIAERSVNKESLTTGNSKEITGGIRTLEAYEQLNLNSAKMLNLASAEDLNLATDTAIKAKAKQSAEIKAAKLHIGSDSENVLAMIAELHDQVKALTDALITHGHSSNGAAPPTTAGQITAVGVKVEGIKTRLSAITL